MAFMPAAVATPTETEAAEVVTTAEVVAASEPAAASSVPEAVPPEPREAAAPEPPDEPRLQEPVAEPPVVAAQTVAAPEEPPAEAPATSDAVVSPPVTPALPPTQPQSSLPVARHLMPPRVAMGRGRSPVPGLRQNSVSVVAVVAGAVGQATAQGVAHDMDQEASLETRIRDAVQAAVRYPAAARMMDVTGRARVQLDYRNGVVDGPLLAQSSGAPLLDQAALNAAQNAHYPATPVALAGRLMRFLVWVEFRTG